MASPASRSDGGPYGSFLVGVLSLGAAFAVFVFSHRVVVVVSGYRVQCGSVGWPEFVDSQHDHQICTGHFDESRLLIIALLCGVTAAFVGCAVTNRIALRRKALLLSDGSTILRSARPRDAKAVGATIDDVVVEAMGWQRADGARPRVALASAANEEVMVIVDAATTRAASVLTLQYERDTARLGMWIGPEHRGRGHMGRAVRLLADHLNAKAMTVMAETAVTNLAAQRVFEGAGFSEVGRRLVRLPNKAEVAGLIYFRYPVASTTRVAAAGRRSGLRRW